MLVRCTQCNKTLKVPDTAAGKRIRCPACSAVVDVPLSALTAPTSTSSGAAVQIPAEGSPAIRKARSVSSESRSTADASPSTSGGSKAASSSQVSRETSSRGNSSSSSQSRDSVRSDRGTPARSTSSQRPRKPSRPVEQEDDDFGYGSYEDDEADYLNSNPFAPPRTGSSSRSQSGSRAVGHSDVASRKLAGLGLLIQGWASVTIFLLIVFVLVLGIITAVLAARGSAPGSVGLRFLGGIAGFGILISVIVGLVGKFLCLAIPQRSGAKGLIITVICCLVFQLLFAIIQGVSDQNSGNPFQRIPFPQSSSITQLVFLVIGLACGLTQVICYELFLKKVSNYVGRDDLARQAMTILIGIPVCVGVIFVCNILARIMVVMGISPVFGLVMLAPNLVAMIAIIVFVVMHVSLLFRVGWALRG